MVSDYPQIRSKIKRFLYRQKHYLSQLSDEAAQKDWSIYLFGGAPRGGFVSERYVPRDFDLVVDDSSYDEVISFFERDLVRTNRFGGSKVIHDGLEFDIWPLSSTWAFREGLVRDVTFEGLSRTTFFNIDSLVVELTAKGGERATYENGFIKAISEKLLDINLMENPFPQLCLIRALRLALQFDLWWSPRLVQYSRDRLAESDFKDFVDLEYSHYGENIFSEVAYGRLRDHLEKHSHEFPLFKAPVFQAELFMPRVEGRDNANKDEAEVESASAPKRGIHSRHVIRKRG